MQHSLRLSLILLVGMGGIIGATARYTVSSLFAGVDGFPYATLLVNLIGCFFLSWLLSSYSLLEKLGKDAVTALGTGVIGSFTTFSTFAVETIELGQTKVSLAIFYVLVNIFGSLLLCYIGYKLAVKRRDES